jgi:hypothetical protein
MALRIQVKTAVVLPDREEVTGSNPAGRGAQQITGAIVLGQSEMALTGKEQHVVEALGAPRPAHLQEPADRRIHPNR